MQHNRSFSFIRRPYRLNAMSVIADFFRWLYALLLRGVSLITTVGGQITAAITGAVAFCGTLFSKFTWLSSATQWVQSATSQVENLINGADSDYVQFLFGWFALDRLVQILAVVVSCTIGVVVAIFVTCLVALFAFIPTILLVRAILKLLAIATGGMVKP